MLKAELRKIEARKKEREKKTADLQKLIAQVGHWRHFKCCALRLPILLFSPRPMAICWATGRNLARRSSWPTEPGKTAR